MKPEQSPEVVHPTPWMAGRYEILDVLGKGGMGAVHRALDHGTGREIALKTLELVQPVTIAMFEREYRTLASLQHPRVIRVDDYGCTEDGRRYYTMEILSGKDLAELAPLPWREACRHLRDVAACLALLHSRQLLHRDVSPKNVRIGADGRAKLIDFGALCEFGRQREVVGTAACMAPEVVAGGELDARTDLYALGCVAYWTLTGRSPYSPLNVHAVEHAHQTTVPEPPSRLVDGIPESLDRLVMSLLALDRVERPAGADGIIDRLNAIAGLDEESLGDLARSHLLSAPMVGRDREAEQLRDLCKRAARGQGGVAVVHGSQGNGRSRLLREAIVDARLVGLTALKVDVLSHAEPLAALRALGKALLRAAPQAAREALPAYLPVLNEDLPDLVKAAGLAVPSERPPFTRDPKERRVRLQNAMADWAADVSRHQPLLVVLDDVHAMETTAAGCVVVLAHAAARAPLSLIVSASQDVESPPAIASLDSLASRLDLGPLEFESIDHLLNSGFGEVPHRVRLSRWLYTVGHGNPAHTFILLTELLARQIVRYEGGSWVLPSQLSERDLPQSIVGVLKGRLDRLGPAARKLAQTLALHRGSLPMPVVSQLLPTVDAAAVSAALEELAAAELVVRTEAECRVAQETARRLLMESMRGQTIRTLHRTLARAMRHEHARVFRELRAGNTDALSTDDLVMALQVGWYMVDGGHPRAGHRVLRDAAIALTVRGDGFVEAVPVLERALASYRAEQRSPYEVAPLLILLTLAGTYADWRLTYSHGQEAMARFCEASGIDRARRWSRWLGKRLALALAIPVAAVLFVCTKRRHMTPTFKHLFLGLMGIGSAVFGAYVTLEDRERSQTLREQLEPLGWFPKRHPVNLIYRFQRALVENTLGHYAACRALGDGTLTSLLERGDIRGLPEEARAQLKVGLCLLLGHMATLRTDGRAAEILDVLESVPTSVSRQATAGIRAAYHAHRGEHVQRVRFQSQLDMLAAQVGLTWREDLTAGRRLWGTLALCEDVIGLKRLHRKFAPLVDEVPSLRRVHDAVHAAYLCERGTAADALERYGSTLEQAALEGTTPALLYAAVYARMLRRAGQYEQALQVCTTALERSHEGDLQYGVAVFGARLERTLCLAELGECERATEAAAALVQEQQGHDNPMLHGLAHGAAGRVALVRRDPEAFAEHLAAMADWLRRTDNPSLLAQCHNLAEEGRSLGLSAQRPEATPLTTSTIPPRVQRLRQMFERCESPGEKLDAALSAVIHASRVERGYLYLLRGGRLELAAPRRGVSPPATLLEHLEQSLLPLVQRPPDALSADDDDPDTVLIPCSPESVVVTDGSRYRCAVLSTCEDWSRGFVGVVAMSEEDQVPANLLPTLLMEVARGLTGATDVREVYLQTTGF